jgi:hypothetical protein
MESEEKTSRREFLEATGGVLTTATLLNAQTGSGGDIQRRPLGKSGLQVSILGVAGHHLGSTTTTARAKNGWAPR